MKFYQYINEGSFPLIPDDQKKSNLKKAFDLIDKSNLKDLFYKFEITDKIDVYGTKYPQINIFFKEIPFDGLVLQKIIYIDAQTNFNDMLNFKAYEEFITNTDPDKARGVYWEIGKREFKGKTENVVRQLQEFYNNGKLYYKEYLLQQMEKFFEKDPHDIKLIYDILTPDERRRFLEKEPSIINYFSHPSKSELTYILKNYPWTLTDQMFSKCPEDCNDLKSQWKVGKARKQIGL